MTHEDAIDELLDMSPALARLQRAVAAAQVVELGAFSADEAARLYQLTPADLDEGQQELARRQKAA